MNLRTGLPLGGDGTVYHVDGRLMLLGLPKNWLRLTSIEQGVAFPILGTDRELPNLQQRTRQTPGGYRLQQDETMG